MTSPTLHTTLDRARWFLIPAGEIGPAGTLAVIDLAGNEQKLHPLWLGRHEVPEERALAILRGEFGETLDELRGAADGALSEFRDKIAALKRAQAAEGSPYNGDSLPALVALAKALPGLVADSLSSEGERQKAATARAAHVEERLRQAGIDLEGKLNAFPGRLSALREDIRHEKSE